jgi:zona occludens toxin
MIELRTGIPGSGKTLSAMADLFAMVKRWEKHPDEARPIFVHGVKDLALPHSPVPLVKLPAKPGTPEVFAPDWDAMPDGAYVFIDEAQSLFPPRSSQSAAPPHVAWLNTHRHRGFDICFVTQHPKLIDGSLRALVGKHRHYRRLFGMQRAICYEWDACSDSLAGTANAVTSSFSYPRDAFKFYKSAEIHTKQSFRLPLWLVIPFVGLAIGAVAVPRAYSSLSNGIAGKGLSAPPIPAPTASGGALAPTAQPAQAAPVQAVQASAQVPARPSVAGCMSTATRCLCVDREGFTLAFSLDDCRAASVELGKVVPYDLQSRDPVQLVPEKPAARVGL